MKPYFTTLLFSHLVLSKICQLYVKGNLKVRKAKKKTFEGILFHSWDEPNFVFAIYFSLISFHIIVVYLYLPSLFNFLIKNLSKNTLLI